MIQFLFISKKYKNDGSVLSLTPSYEAFFSKFISALKSI